MTSKERDAIWYVWQRTKSFDEEYAHIKKAYKNQGFFAEYDIAKFVAKKYPDMVEDIVRTAYATNFSGVVPDGYNNVSKADIAKEMKGQFPKLSENTIKELIDAYWGTITKALKSDKSAFIRINNIGSFRIVTKKYNKINRNGKVTKGATTEKVKFEPSKNMENYVIRGKDTTKKRTNSGKKSSKKSSTSKSTTTTKKTSTKSKSTRGKSKKTKSKNTKKH